MLTAADVMTTAVITLRPETSIHEIAKRLCDHHISGVPVVEKTGNCSASSAKAT